MNKMLPKTLTWWCMVFAFLAGINQAKANDHAPNKFAAPTVTISTTTSSLFNAPSFIVTAAFSEQVYNFTLADITVTNGTVSSLAFGDFITFTFAVTPLGDGPVTVQIVEDGVINIDNVGNTASNTLSMFYDSNPPELTGISLPGGTYKLGDVITFTAQSDEILNVAGSPYLSFNVGSSPVHADLVGSDGSASPTFMYTVKAGDLDNDGIVLTSNTINMNGGVMHDIAGNALDPNLPAGSLSFPGIIIDGVAPTVTSVDVPAVNYYHAGQTLNFSVHTSEIVPVAGTPTLDVIIGSNTRSALFVGGSSTNTLSFTYTVQPGDNDMDGISLGTINLNGGAIQDDAGNKMDLTLNNVSSTNGVNVNTQTPTVVLSTTAAPLVNSSFPVTITFSEAVTTLTVSDFAVTNCTLSNLATNDNIAFTALATPVADGPVSVTLPANAVVNAGLNANSASNTLSSVTVDATAPAIAGGQHFSILANSAEATPINTASATDASGIIQNWSIVSDPSGGAFAIDAATGVITVNNRSLLNNQSGNTVTIALTVSDGLNTSAATPVTIDVLPLNQAPTLHPINNVAVCANSGTQTLQLTGASAGEPTQTYTLSVAAGEPYFDLLSVTNAGILSYKLKSNIASGQATITVTIRDNGGTTNGGVDKSQQSFTLTINPVPVITITSDKGSTVSKGDVVHLTATGGVTYNWDNAAGIVSGRQTAVLEIRPQANTTYPVTVTSAAGCSSTASINIAIIEDFKVDATNIVTPNGDGKNDRWVIHNIDSYPNNEVKIFDRAGRLMYQRRNYNNEWDGTLNGRPLAEGTYYYMLTISGGKTAKGAITIIRDRY